MSDNYSESDILIEVGKSFDECTSKLRDLYGMDGYHILRQRLRPAGIFRRAQVEVQYVIRPVQSRKIPQAFSAADFERERSKILAEAKAGLPQIAKVEKALADIAQKIDTLSVPNQSVPPVIAEIDHLLDLNEFTPTYRKRITDRITREFTLSELDDKNKILESVVKWIGEDMRFSDPESDTQHPKIIMLVGPTGVGKTTTIAKLAAKYCIRFRAAGEKNPCIKLITIDRFRIAAKEQVERYAQAMGIQSSVADSAEDIRKILEMDKDRLDVLLIDTIGYSPNDYESIAKMRTMLSIKDCVPDMYLAVSASSKASDLRTIMKNYEVFDYSSIIVTKCDETEHIGNVISILQERNVPVAYITCGQQVPRDIKHADVMYFIEKLTDMNIDKDLLKLMFLKEENYTEGTVTDDGRSGR